VAKLPTSREISEVMGLTLESLAELREKHAVPTVAKVREVHHRIALLAAVGHTQVEIAGIIGYSTVRISQLLMSPAVQELVAQKREIVQAEDLACIREDHDLGVGNWRKAQLAQAEALEEHLEGVIRIPIRDINTMVADGSDRYGVPRKQQNQNIHAAWTKELEDKLAAVKAQAQAQTVNVITIEPTPGGGFKRRF